MPHETGFFQPIMTARTAAHKPPATRHAGTPNSE
jgi:hypothetical protein